MFLQTIRTQITSLLKELGPRIGSGAAATLTTSQSLSSIIPNVYDKTIQIKGRESSKMGNSSKTRQTNFCCNTTIKTHLYLCLQIFLR
jgi:hypothetical protein